MRKLIFLWLLLAPYTASGTGTILVVGDSLSAGYGLAQNSGWVALLQQRLTQSRYPYRVVNASISGDTSHSGLRRIDTALQTHQPTIVILELGANDGLRGLSLKVMRDNLSAMIKKARAHDAQVLLIGMRLPPNFGLSYTQAFADAYSSVAQQHDIPLVPFLLSGLERDFDLFQRDGLHPSAAAQPQLLDNVWPLLRPLLTAVHPDDEGHQQGAAAHGSQNASNGA